MKGGCGPVVANGDVTMRYGGCGPLIAGGDVSIENGGTQAILAAGGVTIGAGPSPGSSSRRGSPSRRAGGS
jgi:hypothetical protein